MITFKPDSPKNLFYISKALIFTFTIVALPVVYDFIFPSDLVKDNYYFTAGAVIIITMIRDITTNRIHEITFNDDRKEIIVVSRSLVSKSKEKRIPFKVANLEVDQSKSKLFEPLTLSFLKNKMEIFQINKSKHGFSIDTLKTIINTAERFSIPIINQ